MERPQLCRYCDEEAVEKHRLCKPHHKELMEHEKHKLVCKTCGNKFTVSSQYIMSHEDPMCGVCGVTTKWAMVSRRRARL